MTRRLYDFRGFDPDELFYEAVGGPLCGLNIHASVSRIVVEYGSTKTIYEQSEIIERLPSGEAMSIGMRYLARTVSEDE